MDLEPAARTWPHPQITAVQRDALPHARQPVPGASAIGRSQSGRCSAPGVDDGDRHVVRAVGKRDVAVTGPPCLMVLVSASCTSR